MARVVTYPEVVGQLGQLVGREGQLLEAGQGLDRPAPRSEAVPGVEVVWGGRGLRDAKVTRGGVSDSEDEVRNS